MTRGIRKIPESTSGEETQSNLFSEPRNYASDSDCFSSEEPLDDQPLEAVSPQPSYGSSISTLPFSNQQTNELVASESLLQSEPLDIDVIFKKQEETLCKRCLLLGTDRRRKKKR